MLGSLILFLLVPVKKFRATKAVRELGRVGVVQPVAAFQYLKWLIREKGIDFFGSTHCDKVMVLN